MICSSRPPGKEEQEIREVTASFAAAAAATAKLISMTTVVVRLNSAMELMLFYCTSRKDLCCIWLIWLKKKIGQKIPHKKIFFLKKMFTIFFLDFSQVGCG